MYALDSKENFEKELTALMAKIDDSIAATVSNIGTNEGLPSKSGTNKVNRLKLHEYKLKEIGIALVDMTPESWEARKSEFQNEFHAANEVLSSLKGTKVTK